MGHREGEGGRHRGIHGVPALAQHLGPPLRRRSVLGHDHPVAGADGDAAGLGETPAEGGEQQRRGSERGEHCAPGQFVEISMHGRGLRSNPGQPPILTARIACAIRSARFRGREDSPHTPPRRRFAPRRRTRGFLHSLPTAAAPTRRPGRPPGYHCLPMDRTPVRARAALAGGLLLVAPALALAQARVPIEEFRLDNGMRFLAVVRPEMTTVSAGWAAHVGSANERPGITVSATSSNT